MKTKFSSITACIHAYAQRVYRQGSSSSVFFYGDKIYSYGHHYLLGEFIVNPADEQAIIINDEGYSRTTSKHIGIVIQATRQYKQFFTMDVNEEKVIRQLEAWYELLIKAKKPEKYISDANYLYSKHCSYCKWLQVEPDKEVTELVNRFGSITDEERKAIVKKRKLQQKRDKELAKMKELEKIYKFLTYEVDYLHGMTEDYIRISQDKQSIETSQAVKVPIREAKILYMLIKQGKDIKGHRISNYTVISINGVLKIGCHNINRQNMESVGEQIINIETI